MNDVFVSKADSYNSSLMLIANSEENLQRYHEYYDMKCNSLSFMSIENLALDRAEKCQLSVIEYLPKPYYRHMFYIGSKSMPFAVFTSISKKWMAYPIVSKRGRYIDANSLEELFHMIDRHNDNDDLPYLGGSEVRHSTGEWAIDNDGGFRYGDPTDAFKTVMIE